MQETKKETKKAKKETKKASKVGYLSYPTFSEEKDVFMLAPDPMRGDRLFPKVVGKTNIHKIIQESCDFHGVKEVIERYNHGDITALNKNSMFYGDITGIPDNINDINAVLVRSHDVYNRLIPDVKSKFTSFDDFLSSVANGSYFEKVKKGDDNEKIVKDVVKDDNVSVVSGKVSSEDKKGE